MTDMRLPALVPYARFLEVRERRRQIATELAQPSGAAPMPGAPSPESAPTEPGAAAAVAHATAPPAGIQR